ncbi:MAG TPA: FGGY family carbohydrate kinase [Chitinophagaceae bacterium]|nr:FGGY family carbohydrate kinase [Chitinophagaceae bacterium]
MLLLGIDLGSSSVKVSVVDVHSRQCLASAQYPEKEMEFLSLHPGWAEQDPNEWWENIKLAILKCHTQKKYDPTAISAIGIAYQMHGLVMVDQYGTSLRPSIIWCDSRAVETGEKAFHAIGEERCLSHLLNSPGNFTAAKLGWVKENEPGIFYNTDKIMLPGDFIALKFSGESTTTVSALSEGVFWDFSNNSISKDILDHFGFSTSVFPVVKPLFSVHGTLKDNIAQELSMKPGIPIAYKAGDQLNNALSLNVLHPGEVATTAGTSGVIYGVSDELNYDRESRINSFAHVNHNTKQTRIGVLLCINGAGIFNRWVRNLAGNKYSYEELNKMAAEIAPGSEGLMALPFGNGAERMLNNKMLGAHFYELDFNRHSIAHIARAAQESVAFAFRYGLDIMRENGIHPHTVRAARTNLYMSDVFTHSFANTNNVSVEFYEGDGSYGAAMGAGIGAGIYADAATAFEKRKSTGHIDPLHADQYEELYDRWKEWLHEKLLEDQPAGAISFSMS